MNPRVVVGDAESLASALSSDFLSEGNRALTDRGVFTVALPGGSVGSSMFPHLSRLRFDWARTEFFWVDERAVPPQDPESNYALAYSTWLEPARVPRERIHRMRGEEPDLHRSAGAYAHELTRIAGDPPRLDLVLLGVGPDGHVASLFPGHAVLRIERDLVASVENAPKPPPRRLTLTMPVLVSAERVVVAAFGESKAGVIHDALDNPESKLPVALVTRRARRSLVLLDHEAASLLTSV